MYANIIVDIAHTQVDRLYTYRIPDGLQVQAGQRVLAPFGGKNKDIEGFVLEVVPQAEAAGFQIKPLKKTLEPYPVLSAEQIALAKWMSSIYHCTLAGALRLMIPAQLRGARVREKSVTRYRLAKNADFEGTIKSITTAAGKIRAPIQKEVLELFRRAEGRMTAEEILAFIPNAREALRALCKKGVLEADNDEKFRDPFKGISVIPDEPAALTCEQSAAYERICAAIDDRAGVILLHGATGSGKTEVYMQAVSHAVDQGGGAIILVPEIALTPQTVGRFRSRFGSRVAVLHSHLSAGERYDEWRRIRLGLVSVVVGARSAVFAPLPELRLIAVDEEHEPSYRSETAPRYSAIEVAAKRCQLEGGALVLGSATPSINSYFRARQGRYELVEMPSRVNKMPLPRVKIADMREEFLNGNNTLFSGPLYQGLQRCLSAGEQAILFINRRGYSTFISCRGCGHVFHCPNCDVSMTYHKSDSRIKCHYCGETRDVPLKCPQCGKPYIKYFGVGTQQVEEQLLKRFTNARAIRMDMDTTRTKDAHQKLLGAFARGEANVLIGTQMVAKGLDMPNVTLVGVIAADAALHIPDYRSAERTFQLLTQVAGRAGRDKKPGTVVVQTYSPDHPSVVYAATHDYKSFYQYEIRQRRNALFPPYSLFIRLLFTGGDDETLQMSASSYADSLKEAVLQRMQSVGADPRELLMFICTPSPVRRRQGLFRSQIIIKLLRTAHTAAILSRIYDFSSERYMKELISIQINPSDMF